MTIPDITPLPRGPNGEEIQNTFRNMQSGSATVTSAGTKVPLSNTAHEAKRLDVTANYSNTDMVVVGGTGVVGAAVGRKGVPIAPGNTYTFTITDISQVYVDSVVNGEGVTFNYFY